jgi:hypothetical protein
MTDLITADLHLSDNPRDAYRHAFLPWLRKLVQKRNVERVLLLGDLAEEKDRHGAWLTNTIVDELSKLASWCPVWIIPGNHDYRDVEVPFFEFLKEVKNIRWIGRPTGIGRDIFLPHTRDHERDWKGIAFKDYEWAFAHNTFTGAETGFGYKLEGIPLSVFPKGLRVVSGDVHFPQTLGALTYVGAPCLNDFGEDFEPRVLMRDGDRLTSIAYPGPQKRLVTVRSVKELKQLSFNQDDVLKVQVTLDSPAAYQDWPNIRAAVREWGAAHEYDLHAVQPLVEGGTMRAEKKPLKIAAQSDEEVLDAYAKQRGVDERTLKTGHFLMEKAG